MATSTTSTLSTSLKNVYADRYFKAFQNQNCPLLDLIDECPDEPVKGAGWVFPYYLYTPKNSRVNSEGGAMGTVQQRGEVQGTITASEFLGWFNISEMLINAGEKKGAWNGGELARHTDETTIDITKLMQRMFMVSHGTGRLAVVNATITDTYFIAKNNEGVTNLMEGDLIDSYNLDSGGAAQNQAKRITAIDYSTRKVSFGASLTWTADHGIYVAGDYGRGTMGVRGWVDNATYAASVGGQARSSYPQLNAQVRGDDTNPVELTEEDMRQVCDDVFKRGGQIDTIIGGPGVLNAFAEISTGNRRYAGDSGTTKFHLGQKAGDLLFSYDKGDVTLKKDANVPAREMYFLSLKQSWMKHTLKKLGWFDRGGSMFLPYPGSGVYSTSWIAMILAQMAISCFAPAWNGVRRGILDKSVAGDV